MTAFPAHLVDARWLSPSVRSLVFEPRQKRFAFRAGQSVQLTVPTATGLAMRRPYSVASAPGSLEEGRFEIAVTRVEDGPTSTALHALPVGGEVRAEGPHGGLSLGPDEQALRSLFVATGSGLAPFRAIVQEQLQRDSNVTLGILFGCRTAADILWREELERWAQDPSRLRLEITLSQPDASWTGQRGYVQRHMEAFVRSFQPELLMICGLSPMVDEVEELARALGLDGDAVRTESYDR